VRSTTVGPENTLGWFLSKILTTSTNTKPPPDKIYLRLAGCFSYIILITSHVCS
jgi:hypothetical protein